MFNSIIYSTMYRSFIYNTIIKEQLFRVHYKKERRALCWHCTAKWFSVFQLFTHTHSKPDLLMNVALRNRTVRSYCIRLNDARQNNRRVHILFLWEMSKNHDHFSSHANHDTIYCNVRKVHFDGGKRFSCIESFSVVFVFHTPIVFIITSVLPFRWGYVYTVLRRLNSNKTNEHTPIMCFHLCAFRVLVQNCEIL